MVTAVSRQDGIPGMRLNGALRRSYDAGDVREANLDLAFEFPCLDMLRVAGYLG
jgi:hypothetical protein